MKKITSHYFSAVILVMALIVISTANAQVGINITPSTVPALDITKTLDVNGDARLRGDTRLDGALLPGNAAGGVDQMLLSQGTGTPPVWGPGFINTVEITSIAKYYLGPITVACNGADTFTFPITLPEMTVGSVIETTIYNITTSGNCGGGASNFFIGDNFDIRTESLNGGFLLHVTNRSNRIVTFQLGLITYLR